MRNSLSSFLTFAATHFVSVSPESIIMIQGLSKRSKQKMSGSKHARINLFI